MIWASKREKGMGVVSEGNYPIKVGERGGRVEEEGESMSGFGEISITWAKQKRKQERKVPGRPSKPNHQRDDSSKQEVKVKASSYSSSLVQSTNNHDTAKHRKVKGKSKETNYSTTEVEMARPIKNKAREGRVCQKGSL